jgi:hypothetical protein
VGQGRGHEGKWSALLALLHRSVDQAAFVWASFLFARAWHDVLAGSRSSRLYRSHLLASAVTSATTGSIATPIGAATDRRSTAPPAIGGAAAASLALFWLLPAWRSAPGSTLRFRRARHLPRLEFHITPPLQRIVIVGVFAPQFSFLLPPGPDRRRRHWPSPWLRCAA